MALYQDNHRGRLRRSTRPRRRARHRGHGAAHGDHPCGVGRSRSSSPGTSSSPSARRSSSRPTRGCRGAEIRAGEAELVNKDLADGPAVENVVVARRAGATASVREELEHLGRRTRSPARRCSPRFAASGCSAETSRRVVYRLNRGREHGRGGPRLRGRVSAREADPRFRLSAPARAARGRRLSSSTSSPATWRRSGVHGRGSRPLRRDGSHSRRPISVARAASRCVGHRRRHRRLARGGGPREAHRPRPRGRDARPHRGTAARRLHRQRRWSTRSSDGERVTVTTTEVEMVRMQPEEIGWYVDTGEPMDKAGSYAVQGIGAMFIDAVRGNYTNVVGLPLSTLFGMMRDAGIDPAHYR
jgi:hypothetical protein